MTALPEQFPDARPLHLVNAGDMRFRAVDQDTSPELPERIAKTTEALAKLVQAAGEYTTPHARAEGNPNLARIDLRAYVGEGKDTAYHMSLGFDRTTPDDKLILTLETPVGLANPWTFFAAGEFAQHIKVLKLQDFLYRKGADKVPVRDADFSYIYDYRPYGGQQNYDAPKVLIDQILWMLSEANVVQGLQKGPKVIELVPEIAELIGKHTQAEAPTTGLADLTDIGSVERFPAPGVPDQSEADPNHTAQ